MLKPALAQLTTERIVALKFLASLFTLGNQTFDKSITEGQLHIFNSIVFQDKKRVVILCSTQYGKSLVVALACLILTCLRGEKVAIIAPTNDKAKIIMRYFIEHLGDDPLFYGELEYNSKLERLRQEESKSRITLRNGGGIFVISAQERNSSKSIEAAMGEGAKNVIIDEACLISDDNEATLFRMIAGKGADAFYCKIGNPFYSEAPYSHFKKSWEDSEYEGIFIDYVQALKEGRYPQHFIDEAKSKPLFDILFGCEFPEEDLVDPSGYRKLILEKSIKQISREEFDKIEKIGTPKLGCDVGGGGDYNTFVIRWDNLALVASSSRSENIMDNCSEIERLMRDYNIAPNNVAIDDIGIGRGVSDRLKEIGYGVNGVSVGTNPRDKALFSNLKAELCWKAKLWVEADKKIVENKDLYTQLQWIKYKQQSGEKKIIIEAKEDLKRRTGKSPDFFEGFMLTFYEPPIIGIC